MLLNKLELCYIHCDTCILLNLKMDCSFSESRWTHCSVSNQSNSWCHRSGEKPKDHREGWHRSGQHRLQWGHQKGNYCHEVRTIQSSPQNGDVVTGNGGKRLVGGGGRESDICDFLIYSVYAYCYSCIKFPLDTHTLSLSISLSLITEHTQPCTQWWSCMASYHTF